MSETNSKSDFPRGGVRWTPHEERTFLKAVRGGSRHKPLEFFARMHGRGVTGMHQRLLALIAAHLGSAGSGTSPGDNHGG